MNNNRQLPGRRKKMAHSREAHATKAAMPQFNLGHWEKKSEPVTAGDGRYNAGEFSQA